MMLNIKSNRFYSILLSIFIISSDQLSKNIINSNHKSLINNDLILFSIDYVKNYGAAFNIFNGNRIFLSAISTIITLLLIFFWNVFYPLLLSPAPFAACWTVDVICIGCPKKALRLSTFANIPVTRVSIEGRFPPLITPVIL